MSGLTKFEGEILLLKPLGNVQCLLEFLEDVVSIIGNMGPVLNPSFCVHAPHFAHTSNRNLPQWRQISEAFVGDSEGHKWERG